MVIVCRRWVRDVPYPGRTTYWIGRVTTPSVWTGRRDWAAELSAEDAVAILLMNDEHREYAYWIEEV